MTTTPTAKQLADLQTMPNRPSVETLFEPEAGTIAIGRHPEGNDATLELYDPDGAVPTAITGLPGSGISALLNTLWAAELHSGLVTSWVVDLRGTQAGHPLLARSTDTVSGAVELLAQARELVLTRVQAGTGQPTFQPYRPTPEHKLLTLTLIGLSDLLGHDERIREDLESISRLARRGGMSLRSVDTPGIRAPGQLGRFFGNGNLIELLAGRPGSDPEHVLPGMALLTPPYGEGLLFRAWPPLPSTEPTPALVPGADLPDSTDAALDEDLTEVTLELATDDEPDHRERRLLAQTELTALLLAFDDCQDGDDDPHAAEVSLSYVPAEYGGATWRETRYFTDAAASSVLLAFEAGEPA
ncbi:hypothetical protein OG871_39890 (plasmid) [Kitasatospora sp. NBC_00374]|uniref:hypothetical protein n=1 Tax=Kitasatospora sp. NBC_00374 TaxID=2975964 RepID=UPI002F9168BA